MHFTNDQASRINFWLPFLGFAAAWMMDFKHHWWMQVGGWVLMIAVGVVAIYILFHRDFPEEEEEEEDVCADCECPCHHKESND